jgi:hypothetical protein
LDPHSLPAAILQQQEHLMSLSFSLLIPIYGTHQPGQGLMDDASFTLKRKRATNVNSTDLQ